MKRRPGALAALCAVLACLAFAACGDDSSEGTGTQAAASAAEAKPTKVTVAVIPILEAATVYIAKDKGFFEEQGLDVDIKTANTSSAIIPGVVSGQYDIGFSNMVTFLLANQEGLGLKAIAPASQPNSGEKDMTSILATDPSIKTVKDLEGKKVAVNALNNIAAVTVHEAMRKGGADPTSIKLVELGFADQAAGLASGDIDAGLNVEPFQAAAIEDGAHVVSYPYQVIDKDLTIASYVMTDAALKKDPTIAKRFTAAIAKAAELVASDEQVAYDAVKQFSKIDPALFPKIVMSGFPTAINLASVQNWADLMVKDGLIEQAPDVQSMLAPGSYK